jgi:hypothetical protein
MSGFQSDSVCDGTNDCCGGMSVHKAQRILSYGGLGWPQYVAHISDLRTPSHLICIYANDRIQSDSIVNDPLLVSAQGTVQFCQCFGRCLGPDTPVLSAHSGAASAQGSSRL